jgi:hypothetical protein
VAFICPALLELRRVKFYDLSSRLVLARSGWPPSRPEATGPANGGRIVGVLMPLELGAVSHRLLFLATRG